MRMANMTDDITRLALILARMHAMPVHATAATLRAGARLEVSQVAKLCGTTGETVRAWERGTLTPTPNQALTWLSVLYERATGGKGAGS